MLQDMENSGYISAVKLHHNKKRDWEGIPRQKNEEECNNRLDQAEQKIRKLEDKSLEIIQLREKRKEI